MLRHSDEGTCMLGTDNFFFFFNFNVKSGKGVGRDTE